MNVIIDWSGIDGFFSTGIPSTILYPSFIGVIVALFFGGLHKDVNDKTKYLLWVLLVEYLFVLICSTVLCRDKTTLSFDRLELVPFWTYVAVINHVPGVKVWDIILNILLFLPFGFLIKSIYPSIRLGVVLMLGATISFGIESFQFIFRKGVAQIDDIMHNTIGCCIGWILSLFFFHLLELHLKKAR